MGPGSGAYSRSGSVSDSSGDAVVARDASWGWVAHNRISSLGIDPGSEVFLRGHKTVQSAALLRF